MRTVLLSVAFLTLAASAAAQEAAPGATPPAEQPPPATTATAGAQTSVEADTATAEPASAEGDPTIPGSLVIGGGVGAIFPQPFTSLGSHVAVALQLGYRLPFASERLEIMTGAMYSPPGNSFTMKRPDGSYAADMTEKELDVSLGLRVRFLERSSPFNISLGAGGRMFFLQTTSNGSKAGQNYAEFKEQSSQAGFFAVLGGEYILGPGALFLDVDFGYAKLPHTITGDANTGNLTALLGYRFFLL